MQVRQFSPSPTSLTAEGQLEWNASVVKLVQEKEREDKMTQARNFVGLVEEVSEDGGIRSCLPPSDHSPSTQK